MKSRSDWIIAALTLSSAFPAAASAASSLASLGQSDDRQRPEMGRPGPEIPVPSDVLDAFARGDYRTSHRLAEAALSRCLGDYGATPRCVQMMLTTGRLAGESGEAARAERLAAAALDIVRRYLGEEHHYAGSAYNNHAMALTRLGRLAEAEQDGRRAVEIARRALGPDHERTATAHNNLGTILSYEGRLAEAEAEHRIALSIQERVLGEDHQETGATINNLAAVLDTRGRTDEALSLYRRHSPSTLGCSGSDTR